MAPPTRTGAPADLARCGAALAAVAGGCGVPSTEARGQLERVHGVLAGTCPAGARLGYEVVVSFAPSGRAGYGVITQGPALDRLSRRMQALEAGLVAVARSEAWPEERIAWCQAVVRAAFPDWEALDYAVPSAAAVGLGIGWAGSSLALKLYLNTRLDVSHPHDARVRAILDLAGVGGMNEYARLYRDDVATFQGVGVDVGGQLARAKLYVRVRSALAPHYLSELAAALELQDCVQPANRFLAALVTPAQADVLEVGLGLRPGDRPTLKLTVFFAGPLAGTPELAAVQRLLEENRYPSDFLEPALAGAAGAQHRPASSLHAIGIELPDAGRSKLNLYIQSSL
jgi:hypothetical protein